MVTLWIALLRSERTVLGHFGLGEVMGGNPSRDCSKILRIIALSLSRETGDRGVRYP